MTSREICKICFRANPVGFYVPDEIWEAVVPPSHRSKVVCLWCFVHLADEKLVPWDPKIKFYPVSMNSHLGDVKEKTLQNGDLPPVNDYPPMPPVKPPVEEVYSVGQPEGSG